MRAILLAVLALSWLKPVGAHAPVSAAHRANIRPNERSVALACIWQAGGTMNDSDGPGLGCLVLIVGAAFAIWFFSGTPRPLFREEL
jgi:hypothetical protein